MLKKERKSLEVIVIVCCLGLLLPMLVISLYNRPSADDYGYAFLTRDVVENSGNVFQLIKAAWQTNVNYYNTWQGLYTSAFILSLQPAIFGERFYAVAAYIVILLIFLCLLGSIHIINKHLLKKSFLFSLAGALVILTILLLWMPSAVQGIYWYNGAMNYTPWLFVGLLNICIVCDIGTASARKRILLLIGSSVLAVLISGANHVTSVAHILVLSFLAISYLFKKRYYPLIPLATAIIGFAVMYLAPGTHIRQDVLTQSGIADTVIATVLHVRTIAGEWFTIEWAISLAILTPTAIEIAYKNKDLCTKQFPWLSIIFSAMTICVMFCVPYYAMNSFGAGRVTNVIWLAFMILSWYVYIKLWIFIITNNFINMENILSGKYTKTISGVCILSGLALIFLVGKSGSPSNSYIACMDLLSGDAQAYGAEMDAREQVYLSDVKDVVVEPLSAEPYLLVYRELSPDPEYWTNKDMAKYYHKNFIRLNAPLTEAPTP